MSIRADRAPDGWSRVHIPALFLANPNRGPLARELRDYRTTVLGPWLTETIGGCWRLSGFLTYEFENECDAMLFKMAFR